MKNRLQRAARTIAAISAFALGLAASAAMAQGTPPPVPLTIVVFSAPSLGAFLPDVIKQRHLDRANGLDISFQARTPDAYTAEFNSGEFQLGGSAAVLTVGLAQNRGVKVSYLFNLFDYWGAVVTQRPAIKTLADLSGKQLAAASGTTNYRMFEWLAGAQGLKTASVQVINTAPPGLVGYALADRADAVQIWEPAYSLLIAKNPNIRTLNLNIQGEWRKFAGGNHIPYLGVAAHEAWIEQNRALIPRLYKTYQEAARWVAANPVEAAPVIAPKSDADGQKAIVALIRDNARLGMNVAPAAALKREIEAVYRVGKSIGFLDTMPTDATIYMGKMK